MRSRGLKRCIFWWVAAVALPLHAQERSAVTPLPRAHAHNDYRHKRPLFDALDHGFCSVEADIFLVDGQLLVGHDRHELRGGRTLQQLYLDPLRRSVKENGGRVYPGGPTVMLLVDIKADGKAVYATLRDVLASYRDILCRVEDGRYRRGAVQVVISGDRPKEDIAADNPRFAAIDGRLSDLDSDAPPHLMPLISASWWSRFDWRGKGKFPPAQRDELRSIVESAHAAGRRVRFWATPETRELWHELVAAGVDHLNTDHLDQLRDFLSNR